MYYLDYRYDLYRCIYVTLTVCDGLDGHTLNVLSFEVLLYLFLLSRVRSDSCYLLCLHTKLRDELVSYFSLKWDRKRPIQCEKQHLTMYMYIIVMHCLS